MRLFYRLYAMLALNPLEIIHIHIQLCTSHGPNFGAHFWESEYSSVTNLKKKIKCGDGFKKAIYQSGKVNTLSTFCSIMNLMSSNFETKKRNEHESGMATKLE